MTTPSETYGMVPVRLMATHELVLEQIQTAINLGRFAPGDHLPPERDLASMLHVSRTTVREAIAILEERGVVEVRRGRSGGLIVREAYSTPSDLRKLLRAQREEVRDTFDYRVAVESAAARLAAERRTAADVKTLRRLLTQLDDAIADHSDDGGHGYVRFQHLDSQFHLAIANAARSTRMARSILEARSAMFLPVGAVFAKPVPTANDLHEQVVDAIAERDGDRASDIMAAHINGTRATIESWL